MIKEMPHDLLTEKSLLGCLLIDAHCYDMIYSAEYTPFQRWSLSAGAQQTADGLGMLVCQAAAAFKIWFDFDPETGPVIEQLRG